LALTGNLVSKSFKFIIPLFLRLKGLADNRFRINLLASPTLARATNPETSLGTAHGQAATEPKAAAL